MAKGIRTLKALAGLQKLVDEFEGNGSLAAHERFRERVEALERLDAYDLDSQRSSCGLESAEAGWYRRALALQSRLESANSELYDDIRKAIRHGDGRDALLRWAAKIDGEAPPHSDANRRSDSDSYDYLDELVSGVFRFAVPDEPKIELTQEMVAYQPTPARHVFDLIRRTKLSIQDVFIDLGAGLGHVALLVAACTEAHAIGIELEPAYIACARRCVANLNLGKATFVEQDAREADLLNGTVFYLYTPFRGAIFRAVLERLRRHASTREIRVCTFGPCTTLVRSESWLVHDPLESGGISVFRSRH